MNATNDIYRKWNVINTFGPVFSDYGFKNWYISLSRGGIIAIPIGIMPSLKAGIGAGLGSSSLMQAGYSKDSEVGGEKIIVDDGNKKWRRYPFDKIESIYAKSNLFSANEFSIKLFGEKSHRYGIGERSQTEEMRALLKQLFYKIYSEKGFEIIE